MNTLERQLALAVGGLGAVMALWFGWTYIDSAFRTRRQKIETLEREISNFQRQVMAGQAARRKIGEYETRSLPPDATLAKSLYQSWLLGQIEKAGFVTPQVRALSPQKEGDLYVKHIFDVSGKGTLPQVVDFLHAFYEADYLHRIVSLVLKPVKESKQLEVSLKIDAASMSTAPTAKALHTLKSDRLALQSKQDYYEKIVDRNLFGPANQPPRLSISGSKDVRINREAQLTAKGSDPDPLDKVRYKMIESSAPDAKFSESSGQFSWTPRQLGKFKFVFEAIDDGFPSQPSKREEIVLNVTDPPAAAPPPVGFRGFDAAKFTVLVGVTEVDGEGEIWLHNRTKGQMLKLRTGEEFEIGSIKGVVKEIGETDFTFESDGKLRKLERGANLDQASVTARPAQAEPSSQTAEPANAPLRTGTNSPQTLSPQ